MADVRIRTRANGPLVVEGPFTLVDANGNAFPLNTSKPAIALCRCGHSKNKPFCDGAHNGCGFNANEAAPLPVQQQNDVQSQQQQQQQQQRQEPALRQQQRQQQQQQ